MKYLISLILLTVVILSCNKDKKMAAAMNAKSEEVVKENIIRKFGYIYNDFNVVEDTIRSGETFGAILDRNHIAANNIFEIAASAKKDSFDVRMLRAGKPYTILATKDTLEQAQIFIYQPSKTEYVVIDFRDSITTKLNKKNIKTVVKEASGIINTSLSEAMDEQGLDYNLVIEMAQIYAWTVDFFHIQKNDNFKIIYEEKYVDDTTYVGIGDVKAAYFEHKGEPIYAFNYVVDSTKQISDYYNEKAENLRRQFLKAPLEYGRVSSRYNLKRFIRYYGRVKPHRGTDFAAGVGTPILATANGTVVESTRRGGNGKYVKIRHNATYSTQYLHMSKRAVNKGDYVKQGDVIGYVGMTGNTSGPHVCYRFWKDGVQVDPFKQKLPSAEPIKDEYKEAYLKYINPYRQKLDSLIAKQPSAIANLSEEDI